MKSVHSLFVILVVSISLTACGTSSPIGGVGKTTVINPPSPNAPPPDSLTVIPGPEYKAGWLHTFLFGEHYRDIWTTPTTVPVLDLTTFAGGLTPVKRTGGFQTKGLRFEGRDGRLYAFRSVNKDPKAVLPSELQETFAADIVQDQISSSNPAAAMVVDVLAEELGVLHPKPMMVMLPDDERLGQYRETFAGMLGIIEDYPSEGPNETPGFGNSSKIVNSIKLFETLEGDNNNQVDPHAMLTARLLDIFVGDWDRHLDQWRWARFQRDSVTRWYPIPRDRDQAFARFDGFLPSIGAMAITQFENFDDEFNDMTSLTFSGRFVDRRLLVSLDKRAWDSLATVVVNKLSDDVIDRAVRSLPPDYLHLRGEWLATALKARRNAFMNVVNAYYEIVSDYVDVHLSDKPEFVEVTRINDESVYVAAHQMNDAGSPGQTLFRRMFVRSETEEVRIYLHGGNDKCIVAGDVSSSIPVRVVGGGGDDELVDESVVRGYLWGFIPFIPAAERCTYFYDDKGDNRFIAGPSCSVDKARYDPPPHGLTQY